MAIKYSILSKDQIREKIGLDGSFKINKGIIIARWLLIDLAEMEIPCGH